MSQPELEIVGIESQPFMENSYIVNLKGRDECLVIDPGLEPKLIAQEVSRRGLKPVALVCTHGHADHIGGNRYLKQLWPDCPIVIGENEAAMLTDARLNLSGIYGVPITSPPAERTLAEGEIYSAAGMDFEVLEIPGHSPGHVVYVWKGAAPYVVIGGDVLFAGSIGRTDFPGGSFERLADGIHRKLFTLPDDTIVWPGHGPATTTGEEKRTNPFVGAAAGIVDLDEI